MPIEEAFTRFVKEHALMHTVPLSRLRGTKIAIDGFVWMKSLQRAINEPLHIAMGGVPAMVEPVVQRELAQFRSAGITPVFVFNGLPTMLSQAPKHSARNPYLLELYEKRERAWCKYHEGHEDSKEFLQASSNIITPEFQMHLLALLRKHGGEYFRAPYMAWAQMAYWCRKGSRCVHNIQGPNELILYEGVETVVLEINFDKKQFSYISKQEVMRPIDEASQGKLTESQFLDCCLLAGLKGQIKHPRHSNQCTLAKLAMTVRRNTSAYDFILSKPKGNSAKSKELAQAHVLTRTQIQQSIVLGMDGQLTLFSPQGQGKVPEEQTYDLQDLWGHKLPNILYFFLSIGVIQSQLLATVVQNQMIESIPQVDTEEYRSLLQKVLPLSRKIAHQLIRHLDDGCPSHQRDPMKCWRWDQTDSRNIPTPTPTLLDEWDVTGTKASLKDVNFLFVIGECASKATRTAEYHTYEEVLCAVYLKSLDMLGYFTHVSGPSEDASVESSGLSMFAHMLLETHAPEFSSQLVLLIELLRTKSLSASHFTYVKPEAQSSRRSSEGKERGVLEKVHYPKMVLPGELQNCTPNQREVYDQNCRLVSRVWSLLPMQVCARGWSSDVSKDLLAFNTIVKTLHRALRSLAEVTTCALFLSGAATVDLACEVSHDLPQLLPFAQESNTSLGVVINHIMRSSMDFGRGLTTPEQRIKYLQERFPTCTHIAEDLHRGVRFWIAARKLVIEATREDSQEAEHGDQLISEELKNQFILADNFLREQLAQVIDLENYSFDLME